MKPIPLFLFCLTLSGLALTLGLQSLPRIYTSKAMIQISSLHSPQLDRRQVWLHDVSEQLHLQECWSDRSASPIPQDQLLAQLDAAVKISPIRLTRLWEISVNHPNPELAAEIANQLARRIATGGTNPPSSGHIVDLAIPSLHPSSPQVPKWAIAGILISLAGSASVARIPGRRNSPRPI